jgi:hypothetical protein
MATPTTLPAAFVAGDVLTAAQMNDLRGAFRVLQVVSANTPTGSGTTISTATYTATGLTATITPQSNTSKILVMVSQPNRKSNANAATEVQSRLYRGVTAVDTNATLSTCYTGVAEELRIMASLSYLDSPATTSATTYTMYGSNGGAGTVSFDFFSSGSITLMEISA